MRRQIVELERRVAELQASEAKLVARVKELSPAATAAVEPPAEPKPYVGLRSLLGGGGSAAADNLKTP